MIRKYNVLDKHVLIVEDEIIVARDLQMLLEQLGYTKTDVVTTGEKAIQYIDENCPDLIMMDVVLPGRMDGIETVEPAFNLPAIWITETQRERAETLGYTVVDPPSIIATHLTEVIKKHLDELTTRQDVQTLINNVKESHPTLVDELVPKLLSVGEVQKVLMNLLNEGITIRDLVTIFESLADNAVTSRDTDILTEYARQSLKRSISATFLNEKDSNSVIALDPSLEQMIMDNVKQTEQGTYLALDPEITAKVYESVEQEANKLISIGRPPILLTSPIVRIYFRRLTEEQFPNLIILSYNELDSQAEIQSVGMVSVS